MMSSESQQVAVPAAEVDSFIGAILANSWTLKRRLGKGGFGTVYLAEKSGSRDSSSANSAKGRAATRAAVKLLPIILDTGAAEQLSSELACLSELNHPNVLRLLAFYPAVKLPMSPSDSGASGPAGDGSGSGWAGTGHGMQGGTTTKQAMILELADIGDVSGMLKAQPGGRLPPSAARDVLVQAARGLAHVHAKNIVHCDVKLENMLISSTNNTGVATNSSILAAATGLSEEEGSPGTDVDGVDSVSGSGSGGGGGDDGPRVPLFNPTLHCLKIADFGLARLGKGSNADVLVDDDASGHKMAGSLYYQAPEALAPSARALNKPTGPTGTASGASSTGVDIGPARDVWALGVALHLMLTGLFPFRSCSVDEKAKALRHPAGEDEGEYWRSDEEGQANGKVGTGTGTGQGRSGVGADMKTPTHAAPQPKPTPSPAGHGEAGSRPGFVAQHAPATGRPVLTNMGGAGAGGLTSPSRGAAERPTISLVGPESARGLDSAKKGPLIAGSSTSAGPLPSVSSSARRLSSHINNEGEAFLTSSEALGSPSGAGRRPGITAMPAGPSTPARMSSLNATSRLRSPSGSTSVEAAAHALTLAMSAVQATRRSPVAADREAAAAAAAAALSVGASTASRRDSDRSEGFDTPSSISSAGAKAVTDKDVGGLAGLAPWYNMAERMVPPPTIIHETHEAIRAGIAAPRCKASLALVERTAGRGARDLIVALLSPDPAARPSMAALLQDPWMHASATGGLNAELMGPETPPSRR